MGDAKILTWTGDSDAPHVLHSTHLLEVYTVGCRKRWLNNRRCLKTHVTRPALLFWCVSNHEEVSTSVQYSMHGCSVFGYSAVSMAAMQNIWLQHSLYCGITTISGVCTALR